MNTVRESEIWVDIEGYEGLYRISNHGRLHVMQRYRNGHWYKERFTVGFFDAYGYLRTSLTNEAHKKMYFKMHQLVGKYFVENPNNYTVINHNDGVKHNNYYKNLQWTTLTENNHHAYNQLGKCLKGAKNGRATLSEQDVRTIKKLSTGPDSDKIFAEKFNTRWQNIQGIRCGWTWKHVTT